MKELFHENGHLTDAAFHALVEEKELSDLERLELAEHLSFCTVCLERYTQMLTEEVLLDPGEKVGTKAIRAHRRKENLLYLKRVFTAVTAACLAIVFWLSGVFSWPTYILPGQNIPEPEKIEIVGKMEPGRIDRLHGSLQSITDKLDRWSAEQVNALTIFDREKENLHGTK